MASDVLKIITTSSDEVHPYSRFNPETLSTQTFNSSPKPVTNSSLDPASTQTTELALMLIIAVSSVLLSLALLLKKRIIKIEVTDEP